MVDVGQVRPLRVFVELALSSLGGAHIGYERLGMYGCFLDFFGQDFLMFVVRAPRAMVRVQCLLEAFKS